MIEGRAWFTTGADGPTLAIVMADVPLAGATMFLADMASPGITIERKLGTLDTCCPGGHREAVHANGPRAPRVHDSPTTR